MSKTTQLQILRRAMSRMKMSLLQSESLTFGIVKNLHVLQETLLDMHQRMSKMKMSLLQSHLLYHKEFTRVARNIL